MHERPLWMEVYWRGVCESGCGTERREVNLHRLHASASFSKLSDHMQCGDGRQVRGAAAVALRT